MVCLWAEEGRGEGESGRSGRGVGEVGEGEKGGKKDCFVE